MVCGICSRKPSVLGPLSRYLFDPHHILISNLTCYRMDDKLCLDNMHCGQSGLSCQSG